MPPLATRQARAMEWSLADASSALETRTMGLVAPRTMPAILAPAYYQQGVGWVKTMTVEEAKALAGL